jgi:hypothetical protein
MPARKKKREALKAAGKRAVTGRAVVRSVEKAAKQLNLMTEEKAPGSTRKRKRR